MKKSLGFTLAELLVVIAIIGILSSIVVVNVSDSRAKGRDAKRIADVASLQIALEMYFDGKTPHQYPQPPGGSFPWIYHDGTSNGGAAWRTLSTRLNPYLSPLPKDPQNKTGQRYYIYIPIDRTGVIIKTKLEKDRNRMKDDACPTTYLPSVDYYDVIIGQSSSVIWRCNSRPSS